MPTLRDIKRRIDSVKKTSQITKAMQMVAAARFRRVQEALENNRPYAEKMQEVIGGLVQGVEEGSHPLIQERPGPGKLELVVVSTDRGLCGGLNTNLFRQTLAHMRERQEEYSEISLNLIGRKAREYFRRREVTIKKSQNHIFPGLPRFELVKPLARELSRSFVEGDADEVAVCFTRFHSMSTQRPEVLTLLPLRTTAEGRDSEGGAREASGLDYIYEPSRDALLEKLLPRYVEVRLYWIMLEALTSEFAARMTAMDNATSNAKEMIDQLTLTYNKARQAAITKELMDIVSGAEALRQQG